MLALVAVLAATLTPTGGPPQPVSFCLLCGEGGASDALSNLILFLPLGAAIAWCGWRGPWTVLAPALLSLSVETAQIWLPGRDASLSDLVFNTAGAAAGIAIVRSSGWWMVPARSRRRALMWGVLAGAVGLFVATGLLFRPDLPRSAYWGQWTPQLGHLEWYGGTIVRAELGTLRVPDGRLPDSDTARALLRARAPLMVRAVAGPPVPGLAPLLSIADDGQREILLLGPDRRGLVYRHRLRAMAARLTEPDVRADGLVLGRAPGDSLVVTVQADGNGYCLVVNTRASCGLGFTLGRGWSLVSYPERLPTWFRLLLDDAWLAGLLFLLGFWLAGRVAGTLAVMIAGGALWLVPAATGLLSTPPGELIGAVVGLAIGLIARRYVGAAPNAA